MFCTKCGKQQPDKQRTLGLIRRSALDRPTFSSLQITSAVKSSLNRSVTIAS